MVRFLKIGSDEVFVGRWERFLETFTFGIFVVIEYFPGIVASIVHVFFQT